MDMLKPNVALRVGILLAFLVVACRNAKGQETTTLRPSSSRDPPVAAALPPAPPGSHYLWNPQSKERLDLRFPAPNGFTRADVEPGSLPAYLRTLPLAPEGTPVVDWRGQVVLDGDDARLAAVVDIDVGTRDLQQCADAIIRMNAEWRYALGDRRIAYRVSSGALLAYDRYLAGERAASNDGRLLLQRTASPLSDDHRTFRSFLDEVFAWANTSSLAQEGVPVSMPQIRAGDFFVMTGKPYGHAVLVLDVSRDSTGNVAVLVGQSYMPAQSFHVLRPHVGSWFILPPDSTELATPFWSPFPMSSLRRLP
jgi:hypothetical protein